MSDGSEVLRGELVYELEMAIDGVMASYGLGFSTCCTDVAEELADIALALDR